MRLSFTEPNLTFELVSTSGNVVKLVVYFDAESRPPRTSNHDGGDLGHKVVLELHASAVSAAADEWELDLVAFPQR